MNHADIRSRVRQVFETALGRPVSPDENVVQSAEAGWDSLKHVEILFMLEESLGVAFEPEEFAELSTSDECVALAARRLAADV